MQVLASRFPLPSVARSTFQSPAKRRRVAATSKPKMLFKTVVCLPPGRQITNPIPISRGEQRANLQEGGIVGKVFINSSWKASEIATEITSIFAQSFGLSKDEILPFIYLR